MEKGLRPPVPNHVHGRITDINARLRIVKLNLERVADRLRSSTDECAEDDVKQPVPINHTAQAKLNITSDLLHDVEVLADELESVVGVADEDVPKSAGRLSREA